MPKNQIYGFYINVLVLSFVPLKIKMRYVAKVSNAHNKKHLERESSYQYTTNGSLLMI